MPGLSNKLANFGGLRNISSTIKQLTDLKHYCVLILNTPIHSQTHLNTSELHMYLHEDNIVAMTHEHVTICFQGAQETWRTLMTHFILGRFLWSGFPPL